MKWPSLVREISSCQTPSTRSPMPISLTFAALHLGCCDALRHGQWTKTGPNAKRQRLKRISDVQERARAHDIAGDRRRRARDRAPARAYLRAGPVRAHGF